MAQRKSNKRLKEFSLIDRLTADLPRSRQTILGAGDDCAILAPPRGPQVVTIDSMVEGVHFRLKWTTPETLGARALTVNLSDIAAMGGTPVACVINLALRRGITERLCARLYAGLIEQARANNTDIVGGNITRASELAITITVIGEIPNGAMRRDTAKIGDDICVTGTIGDAAAGLRILGGKLQARGQARAFLIDRFLNPSARIRPGQKLARLRPLPAAIDVSDGLVQDLGHILKRSSAGAEIETAQVPLSAAYRVIVGDDPMLALGGGDDYELLFCLRPGHSAKSLSRMLGLPVTRIGRITEGHGVTLISPDGAQHRAGSIAGWDQLRTD